MAGRARNQVIFVRSTDTSLPSCPLNFWPSDNQPSPQPSPIGEGVICHPELVSGSCDMLNDRVQSDVQEMLKQVQHDVNNLVRRTYSQNRMRPLPQALPRKGRGKSTSLFTFHPSLKKHCAFTLAEVLITLGIIGVVAAMTMPALITNHQKKQTVVQLKKAYTVLSQALQRSILDNGEVESWDWQSIPNADADLFGQKYILPYLKGADNISSRALGSHKYWKSLDGTYDEGGSCEHCFPEYVLPDGMLFRFTALNFINRPNDHVDKTHLRINIDINGYRGPNQYGRDVFVFSIFPFKNSEKGKVVPGTIEACSDGAAHNTKSRDFLLYNSCWGCKSDHSGTGYGCAAVIMKDGWEIKDDYPW